MAGTEFVDANGNNVQDSGEPGLAGITIQLIGSGNTVVASTTTAADGSYSFTNLAPASYTLKEVAPASPYFETGSALGTAGGSRSGLDTFTGVSLVSGTNATGYNFAVQHYASLSGVEYTDVNGNNVFDSGDTGLSGVTIQMLNAASQVVASTTTASDGTYSFSVPPGTYTVHEVQPSGGFVETASNGRHDRRQPNGRGHDHQRGPGFRGERHGIQLRRANASSLPGASAPGRHAVERQSPAVGDPGRHRSGCTNT